MKWLPTLVSFWNNMQVIQLSISHSQEEAFDDVDELQSSSKVSSHLLLAYVVWLVNSLHPCTFQCDHYSYLLALLEQICNIQLYHPFWMCSAGCFHGWGALPEIPPHVCQAQRKRGCIRNGRLETCNFLLTLSSSSCFIYVRCSHLKAVFSPIDRRNQRRWRCGTWAAEAPRRACWAIPAFRRRRAASQRRSWTMKNWMGWVTANRYICFCLKPVVAQGLFSGCNNRDNDLKCLCCKMYRWCVKSSLCQRGKSLFQLDVISSFTNTPNVFCFFRQQKSKHKGPPPLPRKSNTAYGQSEEVGFSHQVPQQASGVRSVKHQPYS